MSGLVAAATVVALALRLWGLTRQSLWVDEMLTLKYAGLHESLSARDLLVNLHGPLHAALLSLWAQLFGWGELSVRLPQALIAAATVPALYWAARPVFGDGRAVLAAWLLAINPFHVWYGQEVRNYALVILCAILALVAVQRLDRHPGPRRGVALGLAWTAGLLSNLSMAFHVAASFLWGVVRFRDRSRRAAMAGLLVAAALAALTQLPWALQFYERQVRSSYLLRIEPVPDEEKLRGHATAPLLGIPYIFYAFSVGFSLGPSLAELRREPSPTLIRDHAVPVAATAVVFGALVAAGTLGALRGDPRKRLWVTALAIPIAVAFVVAARNVKVFNPRYVAVALPAFVVLVAEGAARLGPRRAGGALVVAAAVLSGVSLVQLQTDPRYWKEDARSVARVLRAEVDAGDLLFVVGTFDPLKRYYWRDAPRGGAFLLRFAMNREGPEVRNRAEEFLSDARSSREAFVLFYRDDFDDPEGKWERFIRDRYEIARTWEYPGVRLWRLGAERGDGNAVSRGPEGTEGT